MEIEIGPNLQLLIAWMFLGVVILSAVVLLFARSTCKDIAELWLEYRKELYKDKGKKDPSEE